MPVKSVIEEIEKEVVDVVKTNFSYVNTSYVPSLEDPVLTYESGVEKKGKRIETCVLYVDIRNSVDLTRKHTTQTMGRIYTAFIKAVLKVARYHSGHTRNILGDRVMIVFPSEDCYTNAIDCAISINHIAQNIINKQFIGVEFKIGIGIDYGELRVIKVGIQRQGAEHGENKGLVWVGYPANFASRLTDIANKEIEEIYFKVTRHPVNPFYFAFSLGTLKNPILSALGSSKPYISSPYSTTVENIEMSSDDFISKMYVDHEGKVDISEGKLISFSKEKRKIDYPPILITEAVYRGFKNANPERQCIKENFWKEYNHKVKHLSSKIFGGSITWTLD